MKKLQHFAILGFIVLCLPSIAQITNSQDATLWKYYGNGYPVEDVLEGAHGWGDLDESIDFQPVSERVDNIGMSHRKFNVMVTNIPVEGATVSLHGYDNLITHANGKIPLGDFNLSSPDVTADKAFSIMRGYYNGHQLYFENAELEAWIKSYEKNSSASFKPIPELVWASENFSAEAKEYHLYWKLDVFVEKEIDRELVYINAQSGNVDFIRHACSSGCAKHKHDTKKTFNRGMVMAGPTPGKGLTRYIGEVDIVSDSIGPMSYRLRDDTRGNGIRTLNAQNTTSPNGAIDFFDEDNYWDLDAAKRDDAAIDAHHGTEMTYDFWQENYNWSSYNGQGSPMICYVHWDNNWFNASWNGMFSRYGDGNGDPLTYIDIVAHEFTHGLTGNTAGLVYAYESGALNESFSDIFGTAVEHHALGDDFGWVLGLPTNPFRNMSNPNQYGDPDTYLGRNWLTGTSDNGGVHTNSGVQNYWYYLLVEGGSGTNDNGDDYDIEPLGWEKATAIAFRNLTNYLTQSSQYFDARLGSLQAAADLYGPCSDEVARVAEAWAAVGVGGIDHELDLHVLDGTSLRSSCDLSTEEEVSLTFRLNPSGCDLKLDSGTLIRLGYIVNDGLFSADEELLLTEDFREGETLEYTFNTKVDLSEPGHYIFNYWVQSGEDESVENDSLSSEGVRNPEIIDNDKLIQFRNFTTSLDSFYFLEFDNSKAEITIDAGAPSRLLVASMTGENTRINRLNLAPAESLNFVTNPSYASSVCFCLNLTDWNDLLLKFSLRQTYSGAHEQNRPDLQSSLRVTVNNEQIGDQFHPITYMDDPWVEHEMDLSEYVGQSVTLCFEGKHFIDRETDNNAGGNTVGDYSHLDNIYFIGNRVSTNDYIELPLEITPNPTSDLVRLNANFSPNEEVIIRAMDVSGKEWLSKTVNSLTSDFVEEISVQEWPKGIYTISLTTESSRAVSKLIVQ